MNIRPRNIQEWSRFFHDHYGAANEGRKWHQFAVMLGVRVCFSISPKHRARPTDFRWHMSKAFAWMIALHNHVARPFDEKPRLGAMSDIGLLLLSEFPRSCPYCDGGECDYDVSLHNSGRRKEKRNANLAKCAALLREDPPAKHFTLQEWADTVLAIYTEDKTISVDNLAGKIAEEYAELIREMAKLGKPSAETYADYTEEFSDLFSRLCVLSARMLADYAHTGTAGEPRTVDDMVWATYKDGCPSCAQRRAQPEDPCMCSSIEKKEGQPGFWDDDALFGPSGRVGDEPRAINLNLAVINVASAGVDARAELAASSDVRLGDFRSLAAALSKLGVSEDDIGGLDDALKRDPRPTESDSYAGHTAAWIGAMTKKAAEGAWNVGVAAAGGVLASLINQFFGLTGG